MKIVYDYHLNILNNDMNKKVPESKVFVSSDEQFIFVHNFLFFYEKFKVIEFEGEETADETEDGKGHLYYNVIRV